MTDIDKKREEIDRGVSWLLSDIYEAGKNGATINYRDRWTGISAYLHSQGVVIKVDRELPSYTPRLESNNLCRLGFGMARRDILKAGYVAVGSLRGDDASSS